MIESVTWLADIVVRFVGGALGIRLARRTSPVYAPAYAVIPRRTPARSKRYE